MTEYSSDEEGTLFCTFAEDVSAVPFAADWAYDASADEYADLFHRVDAHHVTFFSEDPSWGSRGDSMAWNLPPDYIITPATFSP